MIHHLRQVFSRIAAYRLQRAQYNQYDEHRKKIENTIKKILQNVNIIQVNSQSAYHSIGGEMRQESHFYKTVEEYLKQVTTKFDVTMTTYRVSIEILFSGYQRRVPCVQVFFLNQHYYLIPESCS